MADLIKFPVRRRRPLAAYQLRRFATDGSARPTLILCAGSDSEAREQARGFSEDGFRTELWSSGRLLESLPPGDHPVAASIQLLNGSALPESGRGFPVPSQTTDGRSDVMATEKNRSNRETKKPKKAVPKTNAAAPSTKGVISGASKPSGRT